jgi:alanyl-tRNA synthetase
MAGQVAELMREPYPEVLQSIQRVATVVKGEEEKYARLVIPGLENFKRFFAARKRRELTGEDLFYAYGTLGLRPDFMEDWASAEGLAIARSAREGMDRLREEERERAKASWKGVGKEVASPAYQQLAAQQRPEFVGYAALEAQDCRILGIVTREGIVNELPAASVGELVLDRTPFYAEAGGQVGDTGAFLAPDSDEEIARVETTYYPLAGLSAHRITARQRLRVGDRVRAVVDAEAREATMRNHTATHLLHAALRAVLGPHVKQSGSLVAPDRLRFDFSHYAALDPEELAEIERLANQHILRDTPVTEERMDLDAALKSGALAFFGDKYPEKNVRVITVGDFSKELCGGTHVRHAGQIGLLKLTSESSIAAGIRRVEAITGATALAAYQQTLARVQQVAALLKTSDDELVESVERALTQAHAAQKQLESLRRRLAQAQADGLLEHVRRVKNVPVLAARLDDVDRETLRTLADSLRQKLGSAVIVLGTTTNGKVALIAAVTKDLTPRLHAGKIAQSVAERVGGSGGGRADLAEAGGKDPERLAQAIADVYAIVEKML